VHQSRTGSRWGPAHAAWSARSSAEGSHQCRQRWSAPGTGGPAQGQGPGSDSCCCLFLLYKGQPAVAVFPFCIRVSQLLLFFPSVSGSASCCFFHQGPQGPQVATGLSGTGGPLQCPGGQAACDASSSSSHRCGSNEGRVSDQML